YDQIDIAFMIAPNFHPAMKRVVPARQVLGIRSFFNTMGPLLNPAGGRRQVVAAFDKRTAHQIAEILSNFDCERVYSVLARDGLDELSLSARTYVREVHDNKVTARHEFGASTLGFIPVSIQELQCGYRFYTANIIRSVMEGNGEPVHRDI